MPLDGPLLPADWTAEINYLANSEGSMTMSLTDGREIKVPVHPGLNRVFVRLPGAGDAINVRANTAALSVCLASGPVGYLAPVSRSPCECESMTDARETGFNVFRELMPGLLPDGEVNLGTAIQRRAFRDRPRERLRSLMGTGGAQPPRPQPRHARHADRPAGHRRAEDPFPDRPHQRAHRRRDRRGHLSLDRIRRFPAATTACRIAREVFDAQS